VQELVVGPADILVPLDLRHVLVADVAPLEVEHEELVASRCLLISLSLSRLQKQRFRELTQKLLGPA
jgi:hypothetical protein